MLLTSALLLGGCTRGNDRMRATDREQELDAVAAELYDAVSIGTDDQVRYAYDRSANPSCAVELGIEEGFGEGEAWYGRKGYYVREGGPRDFDRQFDQAAEHLRVAGWEVQEYASGPRLRVLDAVEGDVAVRISSPPFNFTVTAGPCAEVLTGVSERYTEVPPGER